MLLIKRSFIFISRPSDSLHRPTLISKVIRHFSVDLFMSKKCYDGTAWRSYDAVTTLEFIKPDVGLPVAKCEQGVHTKSRFRNALTVRSPGGTPYWIADTPGTRRGVEVLLPVCRLCRRQRGVAAQPTHAWPGSAARPVANEVT